VVVFVGGPNLRQGRGEEVACRISAELIHQTAEAAGCIAEACGDLGGTEALDEVSAQGLVLALQRELRGKEEVPVWRSRYLIRSAGLHTQIVLQKHLVVKMFVSEKAPEA